MLVRFHRIPGAVLLATSWLVATVMAAPTPPATKPAPAKPSPTKPSPSTPGTPSTKPAPPDPKPAPARPAPSNPPSNPPANPPNDQRDPRETQEIVKAIAATEKSEQAGAVFKKFLECKGAEERVKLILDPAKYAPEVEKYFSTSPNRDFKPLAVQILGSVSAASRPDKLIFPYFIATDKNKMGFVAVVVETTNGFRVDWPTFATGHDQSLEEFLATKKTGVSKSFLIGISKAHIFGDAPTGGEAKFNAYIIEMPAPQEDQDPVKMFIEKDSPTGQVLSSKLGWSKGHLCYLTLAFEGAPTPFLKVKAYEPYAK